MLRRRRFVALTVLVLFAACGSESGDGNNEDAADEPLSARVTVQVRSTGLGDVLVDADGKTVYLFSKDSPAKSACTGACAELWPPLAVDGQARAGDGLTGAKLTTLEREDGTRQAAINGHPLYRYKPDAKPGDTTGHGVEGTWFAVTPAGDPAGSTGSSSTSSSAPGYGY